MAATTGVGRAGAHHGEILQGVFTVDGTTTRALVTLPCPRFEANARIVLQPHKRHVAVSPTWKTKARRAARLAFDVAGLPQMGANVAVADAIPVARGFGSSTADVVATIRAVCSATESVLDEQEIGRLAVEAEAASDPLMFERAVLFAHREGLLLEDFGVRLPALEVLGFSTSEHGAGVATLGFVPARYSRKDADEFEELRRRLRDAIAAGDVAELGYVASASARLNQRHLPVAGFDRLARLERRVGAAGLQISHSGDIAGLLFDPNAADVDGRVGEARQLLGKVGITKAWRFRTS
jgi:uncharacterized protein involved in propanediol utilization